MTQEVPFTAMFPGLIGNDPNTNTYVFERALKAGTTCEMRVIRRVADGKEFAAKLVRLCRMSERQRLRARAEVTCLANCRHFGVIKFEASYRAGEDLLIITELCDAGDLEFQIQLKANQGQHWDEGTLRIILLQLCLSIHHIHGRNMLHRDIKSANVMITTSGLFKLGDFGFSKQLSPELDISSDIAETLVGTPFYLAPELWRRQRYGSKADMWSLGVLMYRLMAERYPFGSENVGMEQLRQIVLTGQCAPLPTRFSEPLRNIVMSLLNASSALRPEALDLLRHPYLSEHLRVEAGKGAVFANMVSNTALAEDIKAVALHDIAEVTAIVFATGSGAASPAAPAGAVAAVIHEGPVSRYKEGNYAGRYMVLRAETLEIYTSKEQFNKEKTMKEPLRLRDVESVGPVATQATNDNDECVFAVTARDGNCFWFRAQSPQDRAQWMNLIEKALQAEGA